MPVRTRHSIAASILLAPLLFATTTVRSQQEDVDTELESIVVIGHYDNGVGSSDAASQGHITSTLIEEQPLLRPAEVLENVPGLVVTQHSSDGKANQYFLRGHNLDHGTDFATSIDGVPVNMPTGAHGQGYSDLNYLIPELVDRIDYRKGPYYAENGDFSSAGSASIRYRNSLDRGLADLTTGAFGYRRALLANSFSVAGNNSPPRSSVTIDGPTLLSALELMQNHGPWTVSEDIRKVNGLLRLTDGSVARGWSLDGNYYRANWTATDQVPFELIQSGQLSRFASLDPTDGGDTGRSILSGEWHDSDAHGYSKVSAYMQRYRLQLWSNFTLYEFRPATGDQFEQKEQRDIYGGQMLRGWNHDLLGNRSTAEVGLQLRQDDIHVGLFNTQARIPFETVSDNQVSEASAGVYAHEATTWTDWFRSVLGVREDAVFMNVDSLNLPQNSGNASGYKLSPKMSMIFGPWAKTEIFLNAGKGFHSNDARGVTEKVDPTTCIAPVNACAAPPNQVPALVRSKGKEIGLRTEAISGLQSSLALWSLDSDSELVYSADSALGNTAPNGASKRYGLEWNNHVIARPWLLFDADLAWTHARYANMNDNGAAGNLIPNAVAKVARIGITARNFGLWSGSIEARYIGPYPLSQDGSLSAPSAIVTNLRLQRELTKSIAVSLDVLNLFNREYFDIAYGQDYRVSPASPVVSNGVTVHPGEPRQLRLTLKMLL